MSEYARRLRLLLRQYLGDAILEALADPDVEEIYINPDMRIRLVSHARGRRVTGARLRASDVEAFLRAVATLNGVEIGRDSPSLAAALPNAFGKCRIQGFIPPLTEGPSMIIRKPPGRVIGLDEYVAQGILSEEGHEILRDIVARRKNVMVAGPTASGKTTLCNAILAEIVRQFPTERILILEDTPELQCAGEDYLRLRTTEATTMRHLVKYSLRSTPNRIVVGEVRDGAAKDLLDAWITGHPGGVGTVHGEDAERALERLCDLARDGAAGADQRAMVTRAVHYLVLITGHGRHRAVREIAQLMGHSARGFMLEQLLKG